MPRFARPHPKANNGRTEKSNITPGHVRAFQAITSGLYENITLWGCTIDGEPGVAIVMVDQVNADRLAVMPLFVAITDKMVIDFGAEDRGDGEEDTKGPRRYDVLRDLEKPGPSGVE